MDITCVAPYYYRGKLPFHLYYNMFQPFFPLYPKGDYIWFRKQLSFFIWLWRTECFDLKVQVRRTYS